MDPPLNPLFLVHPHIVVDIRLSNVYTDVLQQSVLLNEFRPSFSIDPTTHQHLVFKNAMIAARSRTMPRFRGQGEQCLIENHGIRLGCTLSSLIIIFISLLFFRKFAGRHAGIIAAQLLGFPINYQPATRLIINPALNTRWARDCLV